MNHAPNNKQVHLTQSVTWPRKCSCQMACESIQRFKQCDGRQADRWRQKPSFANNTIPQTH